MVVGLGWGGGDEVLEVSKVSEKAVMEMVSQEVLE